ncbi:MAG TPA: hypothetical protein VIH35_03885 [Kiritimatiellia bacterium]
MRQTLFSLIALALAAGFASSAHAQGGLALGVKIGTLGPGAELTAFLAPEVNLRVGGNYFTYSYDDEIDDIEYEAKLHMQTLLAVLDWHMFENNFRVSAGVVINDNSLDVEGTPTEAEEVGGNLYTPAEMGTLQGSASFDHFAPYVGIGYGNAVADDVALSFVFDLGVVFQGSPDIELSSSGALANDPQFQADLKQEEQDVQDDADAFSIYPVLAFGVAYYFW